MEGVPEGLVAHDDGVEDALVVEGVLVLAQDAELFGAGDGAPVGGFDVARQDLHEGGLAGAVGAGEAVAVAGGEFDGDVIEKGARAVGFGDAVDGDHGLSACLKWVNRALLYPVMAVI